jgi:hypothetical protein
MKTSLSRDFFKASSGIEGLLPKSEEMKGKNWS